MGARTAAAIAIALLGGAAPACGNVIVGTPSATPKTVPLRIRGTPVDATVTIDDQRVGSLSLVGGRGIRVLPGRHRITVEAAGYLPYDVAVEAKAEVVVVDVKLAPVPD